MLRAWSALLPLLCLAQGEDGAGSSPAFPLALERPAPDLGLEDWLGEGDLGDRVVGKVVGGGDVDLDDLGDLGDLGKLIGAGCEPGRAGRSPRSGRAGPHPGLGRSGERRRAGPARRGPRRGQPGPGPHGARDRGGAPGGRGRAGDGPGPPRGGITWPVATTDLLASASPYVDVEANGLAHAFVIGRSGELVWRGDPLEEEKAFLAAVRTALLRTKLARLERAVDEELGKALDLYYPGLLNKATAAAERVESAAGRAKDRALAEDAEPRAVACIQESELDLLRTMREAATRRARFGELVALRRRAEARLPPGLGPRGRGAREGAHPRGQQPRAPGWRSGTGWSSSRTAPPLPRAQGRRR